MSRHRPPRRPPGDAVRHGLAGAAAAGATLALAVPATAPVLATPGVRAGTAVLAPAALRGALAPVTATVPPAERPTDGAALVKAAGLAEEAARLDAADCAPDLDGLGRVRPWVRDAARFLSCLSGEPDLIGVAGRARHSDHPLGLAVDFMVRGERGDRLAACALANATELGISYVIWEQRIDFGDGWHRMPDRGSATENHVDHVHVSFEPRPGRGTPRADRCR